MRLALLFAPRTIFSSTWPALYCHSGWSALLFSRCRSGVARHSRFNLVSMLLEPEEHILVHERRLQGLPAEATVHEDQLDGDQHAPGQRPLRPRQASAPSIGTKNCRNDSEPIVGVARFSETLA